ncbi:hypothetical protein [Microbacterium aurantiacum]|uniref:DUF222 domain-containing protein n=1 Tax=Microbacterium aurantiacum TaxID=162393 RepID=A0AAJ2HIH7_9MICO|nr:hypothetical protein [Microbacterium aurantiacum]MDS0245414.1 hypothetical protein [Microbacterium aurantiacum]
MNTSRLIEFSDEDLAELDEVAHAAERITPALGAMEVENVRNQARAGAIAERVSRRQAASVRSQEMVYRSVAAELAGVTFTTDRSMQAQITQAVEWVECYPDTLAAWEAGRITRGHATAVLRCGTVLPRDARAEFDAQAAEGNGGSVDSPSGTGCRISSPASPRSSPQRSMTG